MKLVMIIRGFRGSKRPREFSKNVFPGVQTELVACQIIQQYQDIGFHHVFSNAFCVLVNFVGNFRGFVRLLEKKNMPPC